MSQIDSFIDEVTEEVRRDRMFALLKRYGWIAVLAVLLIVGGAAYNEYRKASAQAAAERLGDDIIATLARNDAAARAEALTAISTPEPGGQAVLHFLAASAQAEAGDTDAAVASLNAVATTASLPLIYRQIATFKALTLQTETLPASERRQQFEELARPGAPLRLLAEEQLALIDIAEGDTDAALARLQSILQDAESSAGLQQRAAQVIVTQGATPEIPGGTQR